MIEAARAQADRGGMPSVGAATIRCGSAAFGELSGEILRAGHGLRFRARGASMSPLVRDGDVVLVQPVAPRAVRVGDVVLCRSDAGFPVAHRVVRRLDGPDGRRFLVQGDQALRVDGVIPGAQVYGRLVAVVRDGKQIDMERPLMRWLSRLAALRSRWGVGRSARSLLARRVVKRLPVLSRYLA